MQDIETFKGTKMSGCYGNSVEDRYFEQQLFDFLDKVYPEEVEDGDYYEEQKIMEENNE